MIIPPNRFDNIVQKDKPVLRFSEYMEQSTEEINANTENISVLDADVATLNAIGLEFSATNVTTTKEFNADTVTLEQLADVVGSIIQRLQE